MKNRRLGRTNLSISELGLNTASFAGITESKGQALLDTFHQNGGNIIQSAGSFAHPSKEESPATRAERIVGDWMKGSAIKRDTVVLAARVNLVRPQHGGSIQFANLIRESCERSLRRLRVDHLDLVTCEWDDALGRVDDVMEAYDQLIRAGLIRHVVAGGFPPWRVVDSLHRSSLRERCRFEAIEAPYSLANTSAADLESIRMSQEHRIGFIARSPLANGFLARRPVSIRNLWYSERHRANTPHSVGETMLTALAKIADARGVSSAQVALAWVLYNSQVNCALVEPESGAVLREMIQATHFALSGDEMADLYKTTSLQSANWIHVPPSQSASVEFQPAL